MRKTIFSIATEDDSDDISFAVVDNDVLSNNLFDLTELHNELDNSLSVQEIIQETIKDIDEEAPTMESIHLAKKFICRVLEAHGFSQTPYLAMESISDPKLALEAVSKQSDGFFARFYTELKNAFLKMGDNFVETFEIMSDLEARIKKAESTISQCKNNKVTISIPNNIYMQYGEDGESVTDSKEFLAKYKESIEALITVLKETNDYIDHSFLKFFEAIARTFDEDFLLEEFDKFESFKKNIESHFKMTNVKTTFGLKYFDSDVKLGMWQIQSINPVINDYDRRDFKKIKTNVMKSDFSISRTSDVGTTNGSIQLEVDKAFCLEILKLSLALDTEFRKLLSIGKKIKSTSNTGSVLYTTGAPIFMMHALFTGAGRILLKQSLVLNKMTSTSFYLAKNFNKHVIEMVEKAERKLNQ